MSGLLKNRYKLPEEDFTAITRMSTAELGEQMEKAYVHWMTVVEEKKNDPEINMIKEKKKNLAAEVSKDPEIVELKEKLKQKTFEKTSEEKARLDEELKNKSAAMNEDIKTFRARFYTIADIKTKRVIKDQGAN
jgi:hypothetical protein